MRALVAIALVALVALVFAEKSAETVTGIAVRDGFYRQLTVSANPSLAALVNGSATGVSIAAIGATVKPNDGGQSGSASADIAGFKFKNPADTSDNDRGLVFYFGYLGLSGSWDSSAKTASLSGALAEIASSWENVFIYYDNNGQPGFQWLTGADFFDCTKGKAQGFDCVDPQGIIALKDLTWGGIEVTNTSCPSNYNNPNCTIYSFKTSTTDGVFSFTLRLASEPVLVNGVRVEPNYGKIDVEINYPWSNKTLLDAPNAKVSIVAFTAGRAGTAGVNYAEVDGKKAVSFEVNDKSAYFSWDSQAVLAGAASTVYADYHSGDSIAAIDCTKAACGFSGFYIAALQIRQGIFSGLGWKTEMLLFSWNENRPASVLWDPAVGLTATQASASTAVISVASVLLAVVARLF